MPAPGKRQHLRLGDVEEAVRESGQIGIGSKALARAKELLGDLAVELANLLGLLFLLRGQRRLLMDRALQLYLVAAASATSFCRILATLSSTSPACAWI